MQYHYVAYTADRRVVRGVLNAGSTAGAEELLRLRGWHPLSLSGKRTGPDLARLFPSLSQIKPRDVSDFSKQLALLLECGVAMTTALRLLQDNVANRRLRKVIADINTELRSGSSLSKALTRHPKVFGELYVRIVTLGEKTGGLETSLREIVAYMDKQQASRKKVTKALTYPAIVLVMAVAVAALMTMVVLPQMTLMFTSLKVELPLPTRMLLGLTAFVTAHRTELIVSFALLVLVFAGLMVRPAGRALIQRALLAAPMFGRVVQMTELGRFSRTISMLLHAGVSMTDAMEMAAKSTGNIVVKTAVRRVGDELMRGRTLAGAMATQSIFTPALVQMVAIGEETGRLENTLSTIAQAYETEADERTSALISLIEPVMTLIIAVIVGFIALSVVMPMYSVMGSLG